jgi:serine/threonine protein kinase
LGSELQVGDLLDDRFEIQALIDRSGMATIFKARDIQGHQIVVLKVPHAEFRDGRATMRRLAREAALVGKLDHAGIPKIIPVGEKSRPYIVLEYIEGETLGRLLARRGAIPVDEATRFVSRVCDILTYLHRRGVVHHDLKPGNIMISPDGSPRLIDFGIATLTARKALRWFSPRMGTAEYMAPEQIQGDRTDARTDIYNLGGVLYEMATGQAPFHGGVDQDVAAARIARPPQELNDRLSPQVEEIILHAMAPRPSDRYDSAAAMKAELDVPKCVQVTGRYRNPRKFSAWPRRLRVAALGIILIGSQVVLFFLFLWMFQRRLAH